MKDAIEKLMTELNRLQAKKLNTVRANLSTMGYYDGSIVATTYALEVLGVKVRVNCNTLRYEVVEEVK